MNNTPAEVFISYHTDSSRDTVEKICAALEGAGITCWYAPRNVEGPYASSIVNAIAGCKVFLLILNQYSAKSQHVLNEINTAFDRVSKEEPLTILPFKIEECQLSKDAYYYLGRIHVLDGSMPPEVVRIHELIGRIKNILGTQQEIVRRTDSQTANAPREYRLVGSSVYPDNHFVGRTEEIQTIRKKILARNKLFLVGMGGIGKSEIAKMYCDTFKQDYDVILWVSYTGSLVKTFGSDYSFAIKGMDRQDYPEDDDYNYYQRKLRVLKEIADDRILIVVDNFDVDGDPELSNFCSGAYSVIFTTRMKHEHAQCEMMEILPITAREDLLELFKAEYKRAIPAESLTAVEEILEQLQGHPLSIRLVASAMQSRRIAPEKMAAFLRNGAVSMEQQNAKAADIIFGRLKQIFRVSTLSEEELSLLKNLALIPINGVTVETLFDWCGLDDFDVLDELVNKSWIIINPTTDVVHLHPLIINLMEEELECDASCCDNLLEAVFQESLHIVGTTYAHKQMLKELLTTISARLPMNHPRKLEMAIRRVNILFDLSDYGVNELEELLEQTTHLDTKLQLLHRMSHGHCLSGNPEKAIEVARRGLELVEPIPIDELNMTQGHLRFSFYCRIGEALRGLGQYDEALAYARRASEGETRFYSASPESTKAWNNYHLARIMYMRNRGNDLEESERLFTEGIRLLHEAGDNWAPSFFLDFLGQICMQRGDYEKALEKNKEAGNILLPQIGENHQDIAINLQLRGNIYRHAGDEEKALGCYRQALQITENLNMDRMRERMQQIIDSKKIGYLS